MNFLSFFKRMFSGAQALRTISVIEDLFFKSMVMSFEDYFTLGASETLTVVVDPTDFEPLGEGILTRIPFEPLIAVATAGPIRIQFYVGTDYTPETGTVLGSSNRDGTSNITPDVKLIQNPDGLALGTRFAGDLVPSLGAGVGNAQNANNQQGLPFAISNLTKYAVTFTNDDGAGVLLQTKFTWSEIIG